LIRLKYNTGFHDRVLTILGGNWTRLGGVKLALSRQALSLYYHDKQLGRKSNLLTFYKDLKEAGGVKDKQTREISEMMMALKATEDKLSGDLSNRLRDYMDPRDVDSIKVTFYPKGQDGGFVLRPGSIYINTSKLLRDPEAYFDLLVHEVYHARKRKISSYVGYLVHKGLGSKGIYYQCFGQIFEEGVASLIELGESYKPRPSSSVTPQELEKVEAYFKLLNEQLRSRVLYDNHIKDLLEVLGINYYNLCYVVGYYMVRLVYQHMGKQGIDPWTSKHDYKSVLKNYLYACQAFERPSYIDKDLVDDLLSSYQ